MNLSRICCSRFLYFASDLPIRTPTSFRCQTFFCSTHGISGSVHADVFLALRAETRPGLGTCGEHSEGLRIMQLRRLCGMNVEAIGASNSSAIHQESFYRVVIEYFV